MRPIPRDSAFDSTLSMLQDPYRFIATVCGKLGSDLFCARLLFQDTICMTGPEAARLFYDPSRFIRNGAMPRWLAATLFGTDGAQSLDDDDHRDRKKMLMSIMARPQLDRLLAITAKAWTQFALRWSRSGERIVLYEEVSELLARSVCAWAGVPLPEAEVPQRTADLRALFDGAGSVGIRHAQAWLARRRAEKWMVELIEDVRSGRMRPPEGSALFVVARHRTSSGHDLAAEAAAVEMLNVLRPTVAIAVYIVFIVHALHRYPEVHDRVRAGSSDHILRFVQEIRRFYPFFPMVAARVRETFEWRGYQFPAHQRVLLDIYGTNHDPRSWDDPAQFRPARFSCWDEGAFNFIPQGGGDPDLGHRCAGEQVTIQIMQMATNFLTQCIRYEVMPGDLQIDRSRLPALPRDPLVIGNVRVHADMPQASMGREHRP